MTAINGIAGSGLRNGAVDGRRSTVDGKKSDDGKLKKSAKDMEGVFVEQLYKAMRDTVPQEDGALNGGSGEEMFTGLMDQKIAAETPAQWHRGIGDAIYRQLRKGLHGSTGSDAAPAAATPLHTNAPAQAVDEDHR